MDFINKEYFLGILILGMLVIYLIIPQHKIIFKLEKNDKLLNVKEVECNK